jgi:ubiquitin-activating enzyme E1
MLVQFKEVKGMTELNEGKVFEVKTINPYEFSIGDTSNFSDYVSGGIATEVKKTVEMSFVRHSPHSLSLSLSLSPC